MLRYIAFLTVAGGMFLLGRVAAAASAELADGFRMPLVTTAILANALTIAAGITWVALLHVKRPSRRSAMRLAVASAAVVCFLWPASGGGGLVLAILLYVLVLRPAARAAFHDERNA